jgi:hypothetical protein
MGIVMFDQLIGIVGSAANYVSSTTSRFVIEAPVQLLIGLVSTVIATAYLFGRRKASAVQREVKRALNRPKSLVSIEINKFANDRDREFEGSVVSKLNDMFFAWNSAENPNIISIYQTEESVPVENISDIYSYAAKKAGKHARADIVIYGWHARAGATGNVVMQLQGAAANTTQLKTFALDDYDSEQAFERQVYQTVSAALSLRRQHSSGVRLSIPALRAVRAISSSLITSAKEAGELEVASEGIKLQRSLSLELAECSSDPSDLSSISKELAVVVTNWKNATVDHASVVALSSVYAKASLFDQLHDAAELKERVSEEIVRVQSEADDASLRSLYVSYLALCATLSPYAPYNSVGRERHSRLDEVFEDDPAIAAWNFCNGRGAIGRFEIRNGYYPLQSIKEAFYFLPQAMHHAFLENITNFYVERISEDPEPEYFRLLARVCSLLPKATDPKIERLNTATRCQAYGVAATYLQSLGFSAEEIRALCVSELQKLGDLNPAKWDLSTQYEFLLFDRLLNPVMTVTSPSQGLFDEFISRVDDFVTACKKFKGFSHNSLTGVVSALNNAASKTKKIEYARRALGILRDLRISDRFHYAYLQAYALIECLENGGESEKIRSSREAKKQVSRMHSLSMDSGLPAQKLLTDRMVQRLQAALHSDE